VALTGSPETGDESTVQIAVNTLPLLENQAGAERYTRNIITQLIGNDPTHTYHLVLSRVNQDLYRPPSGSFRETVVDLDTRRRPVRILAEQVYLPRLLKRQNDDLLFSPCNIGPRRVPVPMVITLFDLHWLLFPKLFSPLRLAYLRRALDWSARRSAAVLTISENSKKDLIRLLGVPEEKITVTYPGLDPFFEQTPSAEEQEALRGKYGLQQPFILFVGQMHRRKNVLRLIRAFRLLKKQTAVPHRLVLAGGAGDGSEEIMDDIRGPATEDILVTGGLPDSAVRALYRLASCLVYPSLYEGFGLPVLEAMAGGCPVITSNVSSLPEVAGPAALLVDPLREDELAAAMYRVLSEPGLANALREKGWQQAHKFSWENTARGTVAVFNSVLGIHRKSKRPGR
jgi:glycosyltransferase involved in cell wall biosynthesis